MQKNELMYHFTPAPITSNFVPLIVVIYGDESIKLKDFEYKMWNVLQVNSCKIEQKELVKNLIIEISETYECEEYLYVYGDADMDYFSDISTQKGIHMAFDFSRVSLEEEEKRLQTILDKYEKMLPGL